LLADVATRCCHARSRLQPERERLLHRVGQSRVNNDLRVNQSRADVAMAASLLHEGDITPTAD
jgi:hypothetical protein